MSVDTHVQGDKRPSIAALFRSETYRRSSGELCVGLLLINIEGGRSDRCELPIREPPVAVDFLCPGGVRCSGKSEGRIGLDNVVIRNVEVNALKIDSSALAIKQGDGLG